MSDRVRSKASGTNVDRAGGELEGGGDADIKRLKLQRQWAGESPRISDHKPSPRRRKYAQWGRVPAPHSEIHFARRFSCVGFVFAQAYRSGALLPRLSQADRALQNDVTFYIIGNHVEAIFERHGACIDHQFCGFWGFVWRGDTGEPDHRALVAVTHPALVKFDAVFDRGNFFGLSPYVLGIRPFFCRLVCLGLRLLGNLLGFA